MKAPPFLIDLQKWMGNILRRPLKKMGPLNLPLYFPKTEEAIEKRVTAGPRLSAVQRIGIYNQQFWFRIYNLLQSEYPALLRIFGAAEFNRAIVEPYITKYFPDHWSLSLVSRKLPQWIEEEYRGEDKILVHQVAIVDEAFERLYAVQNRPAADLADALQGVLSLQPSVALLELRGDFFSFREKLIGEEVSFWAENEWPEIDVSQKGRYVIYRQGNEIFHEKISDEEFLLLKAFQKGSSIEEACRIVSESERAHIHLGDWFKKWAERRWLTLN